MLENIERRRKDALRMKVPKLLVYKFADTTPWPLDADAYRRCNTTEEVAARKLWLVRPTETVEITADEYSVEDKYRKRDENEVAMQALVADNGKGLAASVQEKLEDELERVKSSTTVDLNYTVVAASECQIIRSLANIWIRDVFCSDKCWGGGGKTRLKSRI